MFQVFWMAGLTFIVLAGVSLILPFPATSFTIAFAVGAAVCLVVALLSRMNFALGNRAPAQPRQVRQGPGVFDGTGEWVASHVWLLAGFISLALAVGVVIFGFGPDDYANHVVAVAVLLSMSVIFFMAEVGALKEYLKPVVQTLWLIASVLAGFLVIHAANEEGLHAWNFPFGWYLFLSCLSAILAILLMVGLLGKATEMALTGGGKGFANLGKAIFLQHGWTLGFFLWTVISLAAMWITLQAGRGDFFFALDMDDAQVESLATGFGLVAFFSAIAFFVSLVPREARV
jgi:hypothetical protein